MSGSRRIGDDHNDQDYDDEDGDNVDLHDNEAGLTSYPHRLCESLAMHMIPNIFACDAADLEPSLLKQF